MIQTKRAKGKANLTEQEDEYFGYWFMPDPYDALQAEAEKNYRKLGIDPNDWETLVELGELIKG
jgi:elongation factor P hydroxylase